MISGKRKEKARSIIQYNHFSLLITIVKNTPKGVFYQFANFLFYYDDTMMLYVFVQLEHFIILTVVSYLA